MSEREKSSHRIYENLAKKIEVSASYKVRYTAKSFTKKVIGKDRKLDPEISDWKIGLITEGLAGSGFDREPLYRFFDWYRFLIGTGEECFWFQDQLLTAGSILKVILEDGKGEYRPLAVNAANSFSHNLIKTEDGTLLLPYRGKILYLDQIGIMAPFCVRALKFFGTERYVKILEKQILFTLTHQCSEDSVFPFHAYDIENGNTQGRNSWGRGIGWWLTGISALLSGAGTFMEQKTELLDYFVKCIAVLSDLQDKNGYLYEDIAAMNHIDTSTTAMCGYASAEVCYARKDDLKPEEYEMMLRFAEMCAGAVLLSADESGNVTDCSGECNNYGDYSTEYGSFYAEGPALSLLHMLLLLSEFSA